MSTGNRRIIVKWSVQHPEGEFLFGDEFPLEWLEQYDDFEAKNVVGVIRDAVAAGETEGTIDRCRTGTAGTTPGRWDWRPAAEQGNPE